jgi:hypothetical protein
MSSIKTTNINPSEALTAFSKKDHFSDKNWVCFFCAFQGLKSDQVITFVDLIEFLQLGLFCNQHDAGPHYPIIQRLGHCPPNPWPRVVAYKYFFFITRDFNRV